MSSPCKSSSGPADPVAARYREAKRKEDEIAEARAKELASPIGENLPLTIKEKAVLAVESRPQE